jgi:hypothetical protein
MKNQFDIDEVILHRGDYGVANANVYLSNSGSISNAKQFHCGRMTTRGLQTIGCVVSNSRYRYLWVIGEGHGRLKVCRVEARFRP